MLVCFCFELAVAEQMSTKCRHIFFFGEYTISNDLSYDNLCDSFSFSFSSVQFSRSVVSESLQPHDHSMPGLPVHHQFQESTQTHLHWVGDAIQPSHPLSSPSPMFNLCQHQGLFQWVSASHQIGVSASTSVLPKNIQDWFPLGWTGWISLQPKGLSRVFSSTTVQKHPFFGAQLSL